MSIVDDIEKIKNKTLTKCSKAKSEPVIRARTALENEYRTGNFQEKLLINAKFFKKKQLIL